MASPYMDGVRRALPIVLGYVPVAFAFGVLAVKSNIPPALVVAMSVFHFAGSGQFVCAGLWGAGVGAMSVIVAVFVVNLRHLLMSAALAEYLAPAGIRVNAVAPGFFINERSRNYLCTPDGGLSERGQNVMRHTPQKRFGEVEDLLGCVEWLLNDDLSSFVTGITVPVDGGFLSSSGI